MVAQTIVILWVHDIAHAFLYVVEVDVAPSDRHAVHSHDAAGAAVLVAERMRQTEHSLNIALCVQTLRNSEVSGSESTKYVRRILPSEH